MSFFVRAYPSGQTTPLPDVPTINVPFVGDELIVGDGRLLRSEELTPGLEPPDDALLLGTLGDRPVLAYPVTRPADDDGIDAIPTPASLRSLFDRLDGEELGIAGYASQLLRWQRTARFCPVCAQPTHNDDGWNQKCAACGFSHYPPASPAVLILIHDGADRILLAQKPGWGKRYSVLAGFVEPGESLEACCYRETIEEVGVTVADATYVGSQPWPFPQQLMVAFSTTYVSGEIVPDPSELADARWFTVDQLPELPPKFALSRQLIDRWVESRQSV